MTEQILPVAVAIAALVALVAVWRVPPFLAFLLVSIGAAAWIGFPADAAGKTLPKTIQTGLGAVFGQLAITLVAGAMLGRLVVASGAAQRIADVLVRLAGPGRLGAQFHAGPALLSRARRDGDHCAQGLAQR